MTIEEQANLASDKLLSGFNCAQAVLYARASELGADKDQLLKVACGFGSGISRQQHVCGAVSGAVMAIGLKYGRGDTDSKAKTEDVYGRVQEFLDEFKDRHGSIMCRDLIGCDLMTEEGQSDFKGRGLLRSVCAECVRTATVYSADS